MNWVIGGASVASGMNGQEGHSGLCFDGIGG